MLQQKMMEMEERMQQRMLESFNAQKDAVEQQVAFNIISKLKRLNPDLLVDPSMLRFNARSPGDASSAQQAAVQLMNRLSTRSNNRGAANKLETEPETFSTKPKFPSSGGVTEEREDGEGGSTEEREDGDSEDLDLT